MKKIIRGKAFVIGNNIDTDQIIPAEHLVYSLTDEDEAKKYGHFALSGVPITQSGLPEGGIPFIDDEDYNSKFKIIIGGANFGCGSSREHAPFALQKAGVQAIVAESYARIFYRNSVDGGFLVPYESTKKLIDKIRTGNLLEIDLASNSLKNISEDQVYNLKPLGNVLPIIQEGGIFEYARKNGMII